MAECQVFRNDDGVIERVEAPNGQPSTLYKTLQDLVKDKEQALRLWAQVYTDSFKNWFGDWERKQGSKVIDENGEPLIVYGDKFQSDIVTPGPNQIKSVLNEGSFAIDKGGYDNTQVRTEAIPGGEGIVMRKVNRQKELEELGAYNVQFIEGGIKYSFDPTNIYFQDKNMSSSTASQQTVAKIKEVLAKMGVSIEDLYTYAKKTDINVKGKTALADLARGVIAIANQQEGQALTEEMVHIATAMIELLTSRIAIFSII